MQTQTQVLYFLFSGRLHNRVQGNPMMELVTLLLGCCRLRRALLTTTLTTLLLLNTYFILSLLSYTPQRSPRSNRPNLLKYNHGLNKDHVMTRNEYSHINGATHFQRFTAEQYSNKCEILRPESSTFSKQQTPFKIYIYDLPPELNTDLSHCVTKYKSAACFRADYCGFGPITSTYSGLSIHGTWQFNLEVILHHVLQYSPYRTNNPSEAEVFYVPYYAAHACLCYATNTQALESNIQLLQRYLNKSPYHKDGLPHLTTIAKIEREHFTATCPLLKALNNTLFRVIGIEEELSMGVRKAYSKYWKPLIVAPYPSYGHYDNTINGDYNAYRRNIANRDRTVYIFVAAGERRSNRFRSAVLDNILSRPHTYRTRFSYEEFLYKTSEKDANFTRYIETQHGMLEAVWLTTPECRGDHHRYTLNWMQRSIFCLQPPGDSPTRKSFYDAILSGCIPVLFKQKYPTKYPFQRFLDYQQFTVSVSEDAITRHNIPIAMFLSRLSPSKIKQMQVSMAKVSRYLQYSYPIIADQPHNDAVKYLLHEIERLKPHW